jgi:hypothetical protein
VTPHKYHSSKAERLSSNIKNKLCTDQVTRNVFVYQSFPSVNTTILAPINLSRDMSHQSSTSANMSQNPTASTSSSNYQSIFDNAIEAYKKKTKNDLRSHPLLAKLQNCDSPDAILNILRGQIPGFDQSLSADDRFTKWLNPTVNVLYTFSAVIGGGISLASFRERLTRSGSDI